MHPLTFHYHRRPPQEKEATRTLLGRSRCDQTLVEVDLPFLMDVDDLRERGSGNPALGDAPGTYVPARNLIFYSLAAYYGEVLAAHWLVGGHNGADGGTFPDATPGFFEGFNALLDIGLLNQSMPPLRVINPLQGLTKNQVIKLGLELSVPFAVTWSCHFDRDVPCGRCASCRERARAFEKVGTDDPLLVKVETGG